MMINSKNYQYLFQTKTNKSNNSNSINNTDTCLFASSTNQFDDNQIELQQQQNYSRLSNSPTIRFDLISSGFLSNSDFDYISKYPINETVAKF